MVRRIAEYLPSKVYLSRVDNLWLAPARRAVLAQQFRWEVPALYNIARATRKATRKPGHIALIEPQLGRQTRYVGFA